MILFRLSNQLITPIKDLVPGAPSWKWQWRFYVRSKLSL